MKDESEFYSDKRNKSGLRAICKRCANKRQVEYQKCDKMKKYQKLYNTVEGRELLRQKAEVRKQYYVSNEYKELKKIRQGEYQQKYQSSDKHKEYLRSRYKSDICYKLTKILGRRLNHALKGNYKAGSAVRDLGCSISFFKKYLEDQFEIGMSWDNYGKGEGKWNIDHKYPLSKVDLADRSQLLGVCHYTNLQPLWEWENLKKSSNVY